jgi:hypothetical protein
MALSPQDRTVFVNAYTRILINAWSSEEFAGRLDSDPKAALRENGLAIPADAEVVLVRQFPEGQPEGDLDVQIALWERGLESKVYELHIPETPQVDTAELTEGDLDSIAAGEITIYACCCPCSCS